MRKDEGLEESVTPRHFAVGNFVSGSLDRERPERTPTIKAQAHAFDFHMGSAKNLVDHFLGDAESPQLGGQLTHENFKDTHLAAHFGRLVPLKLKKISVMKPIIKKRLIKNHCHGEGRRQSEYVLVGLYVQVFWNWQNLAQHRTADGHLAGP